MKRFAIERRLWGYIRPHIGLLVMGLLCMGVGALATGFYAYLVGPVVKFLFAGGLSETDSLTRLLRSAGLQVELGDTAYMLTVLPVLIIGATLVKGLAEGGKTFLVGFLGERVALKLRAELLQKLHRLTFERYDQARTGDMVTRLGADVALVQEGISGAVAALVSDSLKVAVLLGVAVALDWKLALIAAIVLPLVLAPIVFVGRWLKDTADAKQEAIAGMASHVHEDVAGRRVIRDFSLSDNRALRFARLNTGYLKASLRALAARACSSPFMEILGAVGLAATLFVAGLRMEAGSLVPEHFVSFFAAVLLLYEPLKKLGRLHVLVQSGRTGAERAFELLGWEDEADLDKGRHVPEGLNDSIRFEDVHFSYGGRKVLEACELVIPAGKIMALVGESGVGKTTMVELILRHRFPDRGRITLDGISLGDIRLDALRRLISVVEERPVLFDVSILENVRLGRAGAGKAEVMEAIRRARLNGLIEKLPEKEHARIGESGARLSEGERQRVALARAFLKDAPIVILDEVTASLDARNEAAIREAIGELSRGRTIFIIAHRLSTIRDADRIAVLKDGRIVETGTHSELMAHSKIYSRFVALQGDLQ